jgi:hypothetical protein
LARSVGGRATPSRHRSRKIKDLDALTVLGEVLAHCGQDKLIPSIAWNNLHPLLETESGRFVSLQKNLSPALAALSPRMVERILSAQKPDERAVAAFIKFIGDRDAERAKECLSAVSLKLGALSEPVTVRLKAELKPVLGELLARETDTPLFLSAQLLAARLGLAQVDPAAVRARFTSAGHPEATRLQALDALIAFRDPALLTALPAVLSSDSPHFVRRTFAALGRVESPKLADVLLGEYPKLAPELQPLAIDLIMQREPWARKLLDAVLTNKLPKGVLNANHLRKVLESNDRDALWAVRRRSGKFAKSGIPNVKRSWPKWPCISANTSAIRTVARRCSETFARNVTRFTAKAGRSVPTSLRMVARRSSNCSRTCSTRAS